MTKITTPFDFKNHENIKIKIKKKTKNQCQNAECHMVIKNRKRKKHRRTSPDVQFKEFSLTKQKARPKTDYRVNWEPFQKKIR